MSQKKIIVPLDVETSDQARQIVRELKGFVGGFKIGLQLFTAAGPSFVRELTDKGIRIFLDLKFHDIPNTVSRASLEVARLGVWMFNIHSLGGAEMMKKTARDLKEFCFREKIQKPKIIGVTILTSSNQGTLNEIGLEKDLAKQVLSLAQLTAKCGLDGVVASPLETRQIRKTVESKDFLIVTPGIRPEFATKDDQKRVMTPAQAVSVGSDYLVIGRPITKSKDRRKAVKRIIDEIQLGQY